MCSTGASAESETVMPKPQAWGFSGTVLTPLLSIPPRMCGRIFCYYCCNYYVVTKPGAKKERCCRACFNKPRVVVDSTDDSGSSANQEGSPASLESPVSPSERAFG